VTSSAPRHHPRIDTELAAWYHFLGNRTIIRKLLSRFAMRNVGHGHGIIRFSRNETNFAMRRRRNHQSRVGNPCYERITRPRFRAGFLPLLYLSRARREGPKPRSTRKRQESRYDKRRRRSHARNRGRLAAAEGPPPSPVRRTQRLPRYFE